MNVDQDTILYTMWDLVIRLSRLHKNTKPGRSLPPPGSRCIYNALSGEGGSIESKNQVNATAPRAIGNKHGVDPCAWFFCCLGGGLRSAAAVNPCSSCTYKSMETLRHWPSMAHHATNPTPQFQVPSHPLPSAATVSKNILTNQSVFHPK